MGEAKRQGHEREQAEACCNTTSSPSLGPRAPEPCCPVAMAAFTVPTAEARRHKPIARVCCFCAHTRVHGSVEVESYGFWSQRARMPLLQRGEGASQDDGSGYP